MSHRLFDLAPLYAEAETDRFGVTWRSATADDVNDLLRREHYLGPLDRRRLVLGGFIDGEAVAAQVWAWPTSRHLPSDGTWLELVRWCLTPAAGENAGSRMHRFVRRYILFRLPEVTTLVSYSDPSQGHTGALYKSCNWKWAPTWHRLFPPPSGNGDWGTGAQHVKDRWVFVLRDDARRDEILRVKDGRVAVGGDPE